MEWWPNTSSPPLSHTGADQPDPYATAELEYNTGENAMQVPGALGPLSETMIFFHGTDNAKPKKAAARPELTEAPRSSQATTPLSPGSRSKLGTPKSAGSMFSGR